MPEQFKPFELGNQIQERDLVLNEDLFRHIEQQKTALEQSLLNYDERSNLLKIEKQESLQLLIENLPKMNLAIPAANSAGRFFTVVNTTLLYSIFFQKQ